MKRILIFAFLLTFSKTIFSQEMKTDSLLTEKQNAEWITEFEKTNSKSEQIGKIKNKILIDSIFISQNGYDKNCTIKIQNGESMQEAIKKANCECKIVFVLNFKKKAYLLDATEYPKTNKILKLISESNIDKIKVLKGNITSTKYGHQSRCGVVEIYSENRKLKRKVKNVL